MKQSSTSTKPLRAVVRILRKRTLGKLSFLTCRGWNKTFQAMLTEESTNGYKELKSTSTGSLISIEGYWSHTEKGVRVFRVTVMRPHHKFGGSLPDKHAKIANNVRHKQRSADLITNDSFFRYSLFCADVIASVRKTMCEVNFREFNTGVLQSTFEGGLAKPFVTECKALKKRQFLSLTSELKLKRLVAAGATRVCEIGQSFRNEGINTSHSPEFTMLEAYATDMSLRDVMRLVTRIIQRTDSVATERGYSDVLGSSAITSITFAAACETYLGTRSPSLDYLALTQPESFARDMPYATWCNKVLEYSIGRNLKNPTFVTELPAGMSPLVKCKKEDPSVTNRAVLFAQGRSICDIYEDESDSLKVRQALEAQSTETGNPISEDYLSCLEYGIPPTVGIGMGINRIQMLYLPQDLPESIRETILFPLH